MFKFMTFLALIAVTFAKPGHLTTHSVVEEAHVGSVVHSVPSAISHQSITRVHNSAHDAPVVAPVVKTYHAAIAAEPVPIVHAAPIVQAPVVHSASVLHTNVHSAPVVHTAHAYHAAPVVHAAPVLHSTVLHASPSFHHHH
ncbi:A-kinase anchor protein 14-like [Eupeodes corollae]|uniref:A-kinase anchor protein 14-like n=1 Tax=Eupeodes corollae TaxID=290404 RepID=UPI00248F8F17|nr:A-kinase anchor protein 14-like [Eupeodes corollae]